MFASLEIISDIAEIRAFGLTEEEVEGYLEFYYSKLFCQKKAEIA